MKENGKPSFRKGDVVVITGCAGFLGSHLADFFVREGCKVIGIDNLITGRLKNIEHLFKEPNFEFYHHDVTRFVHVPGPVHYILHFASPASPVDYLRMPIHTMKVGAIGTLNMLGMAKEKGAVFLLASTSEVYGNPLVHPQNESYWGNVNPVGIRGVYDEAKRFAEALVLAYHRVHNLKVRIARIFNVYGERMRIDDGRVVPTLIVQALTGKSLTVYGDGQQTRSFCYVEDMIDGIVRLLKVDYNMPVNLGNPDERKIIELAYFIKELTGCSQPIEFCPLPEDDPHRRCPDISLARRLLKWEPRFSLREGLLRTIEYIKKELAHESLR